MPAQEPAPVSSTFAIRCLQRSCGVSGRPEGPTRAHTGLPFSCLLGSPRSSVPAGPTATSPSPRTPRQDPGRGRPHLGLATPSGLLASQPLLSPRRSSRPSLGPLDFLCRGGDQWISLPAAAARLPFCLFCVTSRKALGTERRQGRRAGGGIEETSFSEVHVRL